MAKTPPLHVVVDGSYTNRRMLKKLPVETVLIGRIRKDESIPWIKIKASAYGKQRTFRVKTLAPLRWRAAGEMDLRLVFITPVMYRINPQGKRLYHQPAYLLCTDPNLPLKQILQEYIWRWDIEVNHRDEKIILGVGQAQVRNINSVESVPAAVILRLTSDGQ